MLEKFERAKLVGPFIKVDSPTMRVDFAKGAAYPNAAAIKAFFEGVEWVEFAFDSEERRLVFQKAEGHGKDTVKLTRFNNGAQLSMHIKPVFEMFNLWEFCYKNGIRRLSLLPSTDGICEVRFGPESPITEVQLTLPEV